MFVYVCTYMYQNYFLFYTGVSNLRTPGRNRNKITIVWDPADNPKYNYCGPILYYIVTIVNSLNATDMNITEINKRTTEFSNLINGTSYNISVAAVNKVGTGPSSTIIVTTTDEEGNVCAYIYARIPYMCVCLCVCVCVRVCVCVVGGWVCVCMCGCMGACMDTCVMNIVYVYSYVLCQSSTYVRIHMYVYDIINL